MTREYEPPEVNEVAKPLPNPPKSPPEDEAEN
jgi:hypothetical protein